MRVSLFALILQGATGPELAPFAGLGIGGGLAAFMFYFYRQDRKHSEDRYEALAKDFREIVEHNTEAMTSLRDSLNGKK